MKFFHIFICVVLVGFLIWLNRVFVPADAAVYGGLSWIGWASILFVGFGIGFLVIFNDSTRAFGFFKDRDEKAAPPTNIRTLSSAELSALGLDKYRGPSYPHPVIFPERCIGCQACVDACPHDVLAIVDGTASAVAPDLCMEDTACQAECPVNPKACIIINTAKDVRSNATPTRDGATFETNVPGCYIIGDVSGVPLIKNAVKEGAQVITHIAAELAKAASEPKAAYDVAIIGIGPGGASAAAKASDLKLRYVAIEQDSILSTIVRYPKGKYIFFKPDTNDWKGGIYVAGLGLTKAKYDSDTGGDDNTILEALGQDVVALVHGEAPALHAQLMPLIPQSLQSELSNLLIEKIEKELKKRIVGFLRSKGAGNWPSLYQMHFLPDKQNLIAGFKAEIADQLQTKIPGDQRENILDIWLGNLADRAVVINEKETCTEVKKGEDGDYFTIKTEPKEKPPRTYTARRVIIGIGNMGAPNKLFRVANINEPTPDEQLKIQQESMKIMVDGNEQSKVEYRLSEPMKFKGKNLVVVGGGNVAVEAAVDLVSVRDGAAITPRKPEDMNRVTVLVRDSLAPTVKFGNKFQLYNCAENGILDLRFGVGIKEIREREVVLEDVVTKKELDTIPNDFVFVMIGGARPQTFLEGIGITVK
ncbi:MAG: NAD(P)-binding domain-containing protein [Pyrinomonadaceae bacterium]